MISAPISATPNADYLSIEDVYPSPENDDIYGEIDTTTNELISLANDIVANGIREPIVVTTDNFILSGHRRFHAAKLARLGKVPVRFVDFARADLSEIDYKKELRSYNRQRLKSPAVQHREMLLDIDPELAHRQLIEERDTRDRHRPDPIEIVGSKRRSPISAAKRPMLDAAIKVIEGLKPYWPLTVRQIHYGLLNNPPLRHASKPHSRYANDKKCYKDLTDLLARARLEGLVCFESITDETRPTDCLRFDKNVTQFIDSEFHWFLKNYRRDLLQSQPDHIELVAEKLTIKSILTEVVQQYCLPMTIGRGYCSLDPRANIVSRFKKSGKDRLVLVVVSDFDPDGDEIAESLAKSIRDDFGIENVQAIKALLTQTQTESFGLPENLMEAKKSSPNYKKFTERYGSDKVFELEAVPPADLQRSLRESIDAIIDVNLFNAEIREEKREAAKLQSTRRAVADYCEGLLLEKEGG